MRTRLVRLACLLSALMPGMPVLVALGALGMSAGVTSCASNEEFQERMDRRTERAASFNERRRIRSEAEDQRYNMWFDRIMQ